MSPLKHTLDDLAQYLEYLKDEEPGEIRVSPAVLKDFSSRPAKAGMHPVVPAPASVVSSKPVPAPLERTAQPVPSTGRGLKEIAKVIALCGKCPLHKTRTNVVPGQGALNPDVMFIGEAPGADEDAQGLAFVGRAGQLLTKMIEAMGFTREEVFIGNILKCRPPDNRQPLPDEMAECMPYLKEQIAVIKPKVIVALGATAVKGLLNLESGISKLRGKWFTFQDIDLMPTYHPAYLLRNPSAKKEVWEDLKEVLNKLGRTPPPVKRP